MIVGAAVVLAGCGPADEPRGAVREPVDLLWYGQEGSDDYIRIPGFRTMEDCAQVGASMSRVALAERENACDVALAIVNEIRPDLDTDCAYIAELGKPWFECGTRCRPWEANSRVLRCKDVQEHR